MRPASLLAAVLVAGCGPTLQELQAEPPRFSVTVPVAWDRMSTCLKAAYLDNFGINDLPVAAERRTELILNVPGPGYVINMFAFDIRAVGENSSNVTWRRRTLIGGQEGSERIAREKVEQCAKRE
jgi:hypothetical protein